MCRTVDGGALAWWVLFGRRRFLTGSSGENLSTSIRLAGARKRCRRSNAIISGASIVWQLKFDNCIFSLDISWPGEKYSKA